MTRRTVRAAAATLAALASVSLLTACGAQTTVDATSVAATRSATASSTAPAPTGGAYTVVAPATLRPGDALPAPTGKVVLTVTGTSAFPAGARFDLATLEKLGLVEYAVDDKQAEGHRVTFRGILLSSLLDYVGAAKVTTLHTLALNDYAVDIPVSDTRTYPVMLATAVDGKRMSVERYGPTRVVYPTDGVTLDAAVYDARWIWQLKTIEVR